jgi:hypothetical protein
MIHTVVFCVLTKNKNTINIHTAIVHTKYIVHIHHMAMPTAAIYHSGQQVNRR